MVAGLLQNGAWAFGDPSNPGYGRWWVDTAPLVILTAAGATFELWALTMKRYPRVQRIYAWLIPTLLLLCFAVVAVATMDVWSPTWRPTIYGILSLRYRSTIAPLAIACGCVTIWGLVFPRQISRNVRIHALLLTGILATIAGGSVVAAILLHGNNRQASNATALISATFLALWAGLISRQGEGASQRRLTEAELSELHQGEEDLDSARKFLRFRL